MSLIAIIGLLWIVLLALTVAFCAAAGSADRREVKLLGVRARRPAGRFQPRSAPARAAQACSAQARAAATRSAAEPGSTLRV